MSSAWQSVPHATRNRTVKSIFSNWFPLLIEILDFLWQCFWIYAWASSRFVKIKSCRFPIFCCWLCGRKKYWNPDNFTICISVNLIGSSSKTNADHLSPFCSSNSQYSMFPLEIYFLDGPDSSFHHWCISPKFPTQHRILRDYSSSNGTGRLLMRIKDAPFDRVGAFRLHDLHPSNFQGTPMKNVDDNMFVKASSKVCSNKMFLVSFSELWSRPVYTVESWRQQMLSCGV